MPSIARLASRAPANDRPSLDEAMLEHCLTMARKIASTKMIAAVATSVAFETLAWSRGRQLYQHALRRANAACNPFLIVKISDIPTGTPVTRLSEIVAMIRPFAKRVFLHVPDVDMHWPLSGNIGVSGLVATLPQKSTPAAAACISTRLVRLAVAQNALTCVEGADRTDAIGIIRAAGTRFASGAGLGLDDKGDAINDRGLRLA